MPTGQCKTDPVSGVSGDIYTALKTDRTDSGMSAPVFDASGTPQRNMVGALIESIAASIVAAPGAVTDVTGTAPIVSSGGATPAISIADTTVTPATYGDATHAVTIAVDQKGRITSASQSAITPAGIGADVAGAAAAAQAAAEAFTYSQASIDAKDAATLASAEAFAQPLNAQLTALAGIATNGLIARTAANTFAERTITGTAHDIAVTNGDGVAGNPTLALDTLALSPAGSYGAADHVSAITVDAKGRVTAAASTAIAIGGSAVTSAVSNATTAVNFTGSLSGDVTGTQSSTAVGKIQGHPVSAGAPTDGQLLIGQSLLGSWAPATIGTGSGISVTLGPNTLSIANTGVTSIAGTAPISLSAGTGSVTASISAATDANAGSMSAADKQKLDNIGSTFEGTATTSDLLSHTTTLFTVPSDTTYAVFCEVAALKSDFSKGAGFSLALTIRNNAGTGATVGAVTTVYSAKDDINWSCTLIRTGVTVQVQYQDATTGPETVNWKFRAHICEAP